MIRTERRTQVIDNDLDGFWILIDGFVRAIYWTEDGKRASLAEELKVLELEFELETERAEPEDETSGYWLLD